MGSYTQRAGRPVVIHDGQIVGQASYLDRIMRGDWEERVKEFVDSGVTTFYINVPHGIADFFDAAFWRGVDDYPLHEEGFKLTMDQQAQIVLRLCPQARLFIVCMSSVPIAWTRQHADHMQTDEDGKTYREASLASPLYLTGVRRFLETLVTYAEARPWADRIVGYFIYPFGEGAMPLSHSGKMFDVSAANEAQFRLWLQGKYGSDDALRAAWGDAAVTCATATIPRDREWLARRAAGPALIGGQGPADQTLNCGVNAQGLYHWVEPSQVVREHDYCFYMRDNFLRWVRTMADAVKSAARRLGRERLVGFDITKQPLMGWQIMSIFDGIGDGQSFPNNYYLSGSFGVGELLDDPRLDIIVTPADYHARTLGFAYEAEGVTDSLVLRGKVMVVENDARCYVGAGVDDQGAFRDDTEVAAGLLRNAALTASRGFQSYWCNVGSSYFHAPGIHRTIAKLSPMLNRVDDWPHRETPHAIALVLDDTSPLYEDFTSGYQCLSVIWQRILGLAHCGVPYRIYLLSDLAKAELPAYRVWLFPNLFKVDADIERLLRRHVLRRGQLALFGPATGITDGRQLTAEPASRLLGVPMELHRRSCVRHVIVQDIPGHPITRELPASTVYGDSLPYGPTMTPTKDGLATAGAITLGHANLCWFLHRTGLFLKEFGAGPRGTGDSDYSVIWSAAMPLPANLLRACARYAGCHIWCEEDDVVYASDSIAALHSVKSGRRTLRLPGRYLVTDALTGRSVGRGPTDRVTFTVKAPDTRLFLLAPPPQA
jgi:hypothetical protein